MARASISLGNKSVRDTLTAQDIEEDDVVDLLGKGFYFVEKGHNSLWELLGFHVTEPVELLDSVADTLVVAVDCVRTRERIFGVGTHT